MRASLSEAHNAQSLYFGVSALISNDGEPLREPLPPLLIFNGGAVLWMTGDRHARPVQTKSLVEGSA
jgi:hypothetical protein